MKKLIFALLLCVGAALSALGQSNPPLTVTEPDGSPRVTGVTTLKFSNGSVSCSGKVCTVTTGGGGGSGTVTSVAQSFTGGLISVGGSPITTSGTLALTVAGTSGGIPYFSSASTWASSAALAANALVIGGGAGAAPSTTTTGTGVLTALGVNVGSAGAFVTFNGAGGTPSSLTLTNATGLPPTTGISGWPANASGVLTNNGAGVLSWAAAGDGITIGATTITSGTNTRVLYNNAGVVGEYSVTGTGNAVLSVSPTLTGRLTGADANFATAVTTGIDATAGFQITANSLTTGNGVQASSSSVSSGNVVSIAATGTAATSNTKTALNVSTSGANATSTQTTYGGRFANTSTGTSSTNIGLDVSASGGTNNYGLNVSGGQAVFQLGTASLPSITFTGDTNTGLFGYGNDQFAWTLAGSIQGIFSGTQLRMGPSGVFGWTNSGDAATSNYTTGLVTPAAGVVRVVATSGGIGSLIIGSSSNSIGTSGTATIAVGNGTAPTSSPADEFQLYSADSAAGDANAFARNEAGEVNRLTGLSARNSSSFAKTSDTTLANITGLTRNVEAGRTYYLETELSTTSVSTGGVKFAISGTATATSINYEGVLRDGTTISAATRATALDTTVCAVTAVTAATCRIRGVIVVANAGTLTVQFAQNASDGSASTVLVNQALTLAPIS